MKIGFYIIISYLLFCVVVSLAIQQFDLFGGVNSGDDLSSKKFRNIVEGIENKNYMTDLSGQLCKIEDLLFCNTLTEKETFDQVVKLIAEIPESENYTYKKELQNIVDTEKESTTTDYKSFFKSIMNKIKVHRKQIINDRIRESRSNVNNIAKSDEMVNAATS